MDLEQEFNNRLEKLKSMSKIDLAKSATKTVARWSAAAVVATVVQQFIPEETSKKQKLQFKIGVWALSGAVAHNAGDFAARSVGEKLEFAKEVLEVAKAAGDPEVVKNESSEDTEEETPTE